MGRRKAFEIIKSRPNASLREIARDAGVSPTTVSDVRDRMRRGEGPIRTQRGPATKPRSERTTPLPVSADTATAITTILRGLKNDPSLRLTEAGRTLLRWVASRALQPEERHQVVDKVPPHSTYAVAALARCCADEWLRLAQDLESRTMA